MCEKLNTSLFLRLPPFILQAECQNHIRIVAKLSKEVLLVCGTHAYKPKCRHYAFKVSTSGSRKGACLHGRSFPTADFYILQSWQKLKLLGLEMVAAVKFSKKKGVSPSTSLVMLNNLVKKVHWSLFSPQYSWVWLELENSLVYFKISPYLPNRSMAGITLFAWTSVVVRVKLNEISSQTHHWILITSFGQALHPWD